MNYYDKNLKKILRWGRIGAIACIIAEKSGIKPLQALKDFYRSKTCELLHDESTGLYLYSDQYISAEYLEETGATPIYAR